MDTLLSNLHLHLSEPAVGVVTVGLVLISGLLCVRGRSGSGTDVHRLPKPKGGSWIWGHERVAWEVDDFQWVIERNEELGPTYAMRGALGHPDIMVTSDPTAINYIFTKHPSHYTKAHTIHALAERMIGKGLLWANGATHKRQRAVVAPFFIHSQVRKMDERVGGLVGRFVELFHSANEKEGEVDVTTWMSRIALDIIGAVAFGYDFACGESEEAEIIIDTFEKQTTLGMSVLGFSVPLILRAVPWITDGLFSFTSAQGRVKTLIKEKVGGVLLQRRKEVEEGREMEDRDLLDALIKATDMDSAEGVDEMLDQINTIILAGHETIGKTLSMVLYELSLHPDIQTQLRKEVTEFRGSKPDGRPTYDEYLGNGKLPLLDAVITETLRVHPVISHTERVADRDDVIPLRFPVSTTTSSSITSVKIKAGQVIYVPSVVLNTDPRLWGPDGRTFDPYRWINPPQASPPPPTGGVNGHFGFFEGPRMCVGYRLSIFEMKVIVAELVKRFEFAPVPGKVVRRTWAATMQPYVEGERDEGARLPLVVRSLPCD